VARRGANCPPSETARVRLEGIARGPLADRLRASLHRRHPRCSADDIAEAFQEAYLRALRACPVDDEAAIYAWLRRTMDNLLVDRMRLLSHEAPVGDTAGVFVRASDPSAEPERELERTEERRELAAVFELVSRELAPRQRAVLALYVRGVRRRQIARELGLRERMVKRELERILARARAMLIERSGGGCGEGNGAVLRYAFGLASETEAAHAHVHLASCPSCQSFLERLASWRDAAAAAIPVPAAHEADPGRVERVVHGLAEVATSVKQHIAGPAASLRQHGSDGAAQLKQQASATYFRAVDPTPLSGLRPGAAAAAIGTCLAIGGGAATYCAQNDVNPFEGVAGLVQSQSESERKPEPPAEKQPERQQPPDPPAVPTVTQKPQPPPEPTPSPPAPQQPPAQQPVVQPAAAQQPAEPPPPPPPPPPEPTPPAVQFGEPATPPSGASASTPQPSPAPRQPAPVPASGGSDLYGP
jgi:RNA polymerase sigma factor (sigma-70 family)